MSSQSLQLHELHGWQHQLRDVITDIDELLGLLHLEPAQLPISDAALRSFPLRVPRAFVARMKPADPRDPLLLQVLPSFREEDDTPGYSNDPLSESNFNPAPGLLHKYHGRALLVAAPHCAVNCRYCFRRNFPYQDNTPGRAHWRKTLAHIAADSSIVEVILSGGDPLAASDSWLAWLVGEVVRIPHVRRLRIHTRTPIVMPDRISPEFLSWVGNTGLQTVMVVHCNHGQEIDASVQRAMTALKSCDITLLNQSVMLAGINDSASTLVALSEALFSVGILPYYIHMPDKVRGAAHFDVTEARAREIIQTMKQQLPGYLVPRLVREIPGEAAKAALL